MTWADIVFNASLFGFFDRLFTRHQRPVWNLAPLVDAPGAVAPLWLVASMIVAGVSMWVVHPRAHDVSAEADVDRFFAVILSAALLIAPLGWLYYTFFLVGPFAALWADEQRGMTAGWRRFLYAMVALCLVIPPGIVARHQPSGWATLSIGSAYFWGTLGLWLCAVRPTPKPALLSGLLRLRRF